MEELVKAINLITKKDFWDYINMTLQIIANVTILVTATYGYKQFKIYKDEVRINQCKAGAEKAVQIAQLFADKLLDQIYDVIKICKENGLEKIMDSVKSKNLVNFNVPEFHQIFEDSEAKKITEIVSSISDEEETKIMFALNQMEFVSMMLNTKIADEKTIYQSLHQVCLRFIVDAYPFITLSNTSNNDKVYTNVIKLFNIWNERDISKKIEEKELIKQKIICAKNNINEIDDQAKQIIVESPSIK